MKREEAEKIADELQEMMNKLMMEANEKNPGMFTITEEDREARDARWKARGIEPPPDISEQSRENLIQSLMKEELRNDRTDS